MSFPVEFWLYLLAANVSAFAAFGYDKARAQAGKGRVRERDLLLFALLGGAPGACLGRRIFRHKTRKAGFSAALFAILALEVTLLAVLGYPLLSPPHNPTIGGL